MEAPPQRPLAIEGDWQGVARRVRASQRGHWWIASREGSSCGFGCSFCMGLFLRFRGGPSPRISDSADDGLPTIVDMHMLDGDFLLPFAAVTVEGLQ